MEVRYVPDRIMTLKGVQPVNGSIAYPVGMHPQGCPIVKTMAAVEIQTPGGSRWIGCQHAYIDSTLRMAVVGAPASVTRDWAAV